MNIPHKFLWPAVGAGLLFILIAVGFAVSAHIDRAADKARHDTEIEAQHQFQAEKEKEVADLKVMNEQIRTDAKARQDELQRSLNQVLTASQAASNIRLAYPQMQQPIQQAPTAPDGPKPQPGQEKYIIDADQMQTFFRCGVEKQQCAIRAEAAEKSVANDEKIIADKDEQLKKKDAEITTEKNYNRGGSIGQRIKRKIKPVLCGAIGAGLGAMLNKKHPGQGAAIGSLGGGVACSIF